MELVLGKKITPDLHSLQYHLLISNIHGDDDARTYTEIYLNKDKEEILKMILEFILWCNTQKSNRVLMSEKWLITQKDILESIEDNDERDEIDEVLYDLIERDCFCSDYISKPEIRHIHYYTSEGICYEVKIQK